MITAYHRPKTIEEALTLLTQPDAAPLGGGTLLSKPQADPVRAVDLQLLGLDSVKKQGSALEIGAAATLQSLVESIDCPDALKQGLRLEAAINIRNSATAAGTVVACDGRSTFVCVLLAADAKIEHASLKDSRVEYHTSNIGDFLPLRPRGLITRISMPLNVKLAFEYVSRTPSDKPIVCVAVARWAAGRMRMAVGGYGRSPMLAMDGTSADDLVTAARNAFHEAADEWGSAEYRMVVASTLAKRSMESIK
jgi:CO/xanthine dehydrogenase FAD-binding subunit